MNQIINFRSGYDCKVTFDFGNGNLLEFEKVTFQFCNNLEGVRSFINNQYLEGNLLMLGTEMINLDRILFVTVEELKADDGEIPAIPLEIVE